MDPVVMHRGVRRVLHIRARSGRPSILTCHSNVVGGWGPRCVWMAEQLVGEYAVASRTEQGHDIL